MKQSISSQWYQLRQLFWCFFKISPSTFGGGYAMIPAIVNEAVTARKWLTEVEMSEAISISGAAPGGVGVNIAAFIGFKVLGIRGLIAAVLGMILPVFSIVLALGIFFVTMRFNPKVIAALEGIQIAVIALIVYAGVKMFKMAVFDKSSCAIFAISFVCLSTFAFHPILLIPLGILSGVFIVKIKERFGFSVDLANKNIVSLESKRINPKFPDYFFGEGI